MRRRDIYVVVEISKRLAQKLGDNMRIRLCYSALMPASLITLPHFAISDLILAASSSGELATASTPELNSFDDKALSALERALAGEKLLYERLVEALAPHIRRLQATAAAIAELDMLCAFAERATALDYSAPEFVEEQLIEIQGGRHPVVEGQVDNFIANDTLLSASRQMLIVTGPPVGGKST